MKKGSAVILDILTLLIGSSIWAISINMFLSPNLIAPGGVTGVATILNHFFGFPIGLTIIIINIPLFLIALKFFGKAFLLKTIISTIITSVILDLFFFLPEFTEDKLLATLFGGITSGLGLGIIYARGMTTGGSDLLARLLKKPIPFISYGRMILIIDASVIIIAAIAFKNLSVALYATISVYIVGLITDKILNGMDSAKLVQIISAEKYPEIAKNITEQLKRGATLINAKGFYSGNEKSIIMVVVRKYEIFKLKEIVKKTDPSAFMIIGEVSEVLGEGFKI